MSAALFVTGIAGVLGLAIGSFLNVVVYRVPAGISLLRESRCPACGAPIAWRNIPVLGWLLVGGKCTDCRARISARYPLVEAATGLALAGLTALWWSRLDGGQPRPSDWVVLVAFAYFLAAGIALALIDLDTRRLPDAIVLPSYLVAVGLLTLACLLGASWEDLRRAAIGAAILWFFYWLVRLVRPDGMGGGDVKLAGLVGGYLGWVGWGALAVGGFSAFVLGGVFGVALIVGGSRGVAGSRHPSAGASGARPTETQRPPGRRTAVPFGPWMLAGCWVGIAVGQAWGSAYVRFAGF